MRILTDTVYTRILNPPNAALDKITCYMPVTLVKVGHGLCKPSVGSYFLFVFCSMNIHDAGCLERSLNVIGLEVNQSVDGLSLNR